MEITVNLGEKSYPIHFGRGLLKQAGTLFRLDRKVLVVTDDGVPAVYAETVCRQSAEGSVLTIPQGEQSKNLARFEAVLTAMLDRGFTRVDCVVAVGGGVVGDLAGFAAACYMRGVDFYNVPTTVLSQVDSSVGGKTAVDLHGIKNVIGAFYQPKAVLIDPDVLGTLPARQVSNGMAEAVKMSLTGDAGLFGIFENGDVMGELDTILMRSIQIKKNVVEQDEKETGLRRVLNFGHTIGHAIESSAGSSGLYHGECVALGMLPMCEKQTRARLRAVLEKLRLPTGVQCDADAVYAALLHDKKSGAKGIHAIYVPAPGQYEQVLMAPEQFRPLIKTITNGEAAI